MTLKTYQHNPAHLMLDEAVYFITGATYHKLPLLKPPEVKQMLLDCMQTVFSDYQWALQHWVILDNHYHLLVKSQSGSVMAQIFKNLHGQSGYLIKQSAKLTGRVWWNYWDYCPRDEDDYFRHLNYLFYNPVKHGYVTDLKDYPYSSFLPFLEMQGRMVLENQFRKYRDYKNLYLDNDDF